MLLDKKIIVVGATGRVGREILSILYERGVPYKNIGCAASTKSAGSHVQYGENEKIIVQDIADVDFSGYEIGIFSAGSEVSRVYAIKAAENKCIVVDNTSYFRMHDDVSLIVPEANPEDYYTYTNKYIIANPNCSTIQMVMVLKPLHDAFGLKEVVVSTYQAVSGAGQKGVEELRAQIDSLENSPPQHFKKQIAFNVIPQIDEFSKSLYTREEEKMMNETRKILHIPSLEITATCVRVPVYVGHSVSVFAKFEEKVDILRAREEVSKFPGVTLIDDPDVYGYTTPIECAHKNEVFVSRLRMHPKTKLALSFWCVSDNLRKGAALNSVQITEIVLK
jgi:aspartate-semialdehyde dehydrogenase